MHVAIHPIVTVDEMVAVCSADIIVQASLISTLNGIAVLVLNLIAMIVVAIETVVNIIFIVVIYKSLARFSLL